MLFEGVVKQHLCGGLVAYGRSSGSLKIEAFQDLCNFIAEKDKMEDIEIFGWLVWCIQYDRNKTIFEGSDHEVNDIISYAGYLYADYSSCYKIDKVCSHGTTPMNT